MLFYLVLHNVYTNYFYVFHSIFLNYICLDTHHVIKDIILISALLISFGACLYAFVRHRKTQESMKAMIKELETLQKAESDLISVTGK